MCIWVNKNKKHSKDCLVCDETFETTRSNKKMCSKECSTIMHRNQKKKNYLKKVIEGMKENKL